MHKQVLKQLVLDRILLWLFCFALSLYSDCGRGFVRIEKTCVSISSEAVPKAEIVTKCNEIGATPLVTDSNAMFYQLKSYLQDHMETDDLWSDFKDGWELSSHKLILFIILSILFLYI